MAMRQPVPQGGPTSQEANQVKVTALITRPGSNGADVLVFDHPSAGIQFPAGTGERGEDPRSAVLREAFEETGLDGLSIAEELDVIAPQRHVFHLHLAKRAADEWWVETPDGGGHIWRCHWIAVADAPAIVHAAMREWVAPYSARLAAQPGEPAASLRARFDKHVLPRISHDVFTASLGHRRSPMASRRRTRRAWRDGYRRSRP